MALLEQEKIGMARDLEGADDGQVGHADHLVVTLALDHGQSADLVPVVTEHLIKHTNTRSVSSRHCGVHTYVECSIAREV
eukprot:2844419-Rhodomonas_salina.1